MSTENLRNEITAKNNDEALRKANAKEVDIRIKRQAKQLALSKAKVKADGANTKRQATLDKATRTLVDLRLKRNDMMNIQDYRDSEQLLLEVKVSKYEDKLIKLLAKIDAAQDRERNLTHELNAKFSEFDEKFEGVGDVELAQFHLDDLLRLKSDLSAKVI